MGQIGWSQALKGVRLRKNFESEKEGRDAILRSPKCHKRTHVLSNTVVVCVALVVPDTAFSKRMLRVSPLLGLETGDDTRFYCPGW